jgi:hypothetical protein
MYSLAQNGYTWDEVRRLLSQSRTVSYGFDLLDKNDRAIGEIHSPDCKIYNNIEANIQRSASLSMVEEKDIDFTSDRLRPYMRLYTERGSLVYPLGVFLMSSPARKCVAGAINRTVDCYDKTQILEDDRFDTRYTVAKNTAYTAAVTNIITSAGITQSNIVQSALETETDIEFPLGTSKLKACNDLLAAINYSALFADSHGYLRAIPYQDPTTRAIDAFFATDKVSIVQPGAQEELDIFFAPNKIVRYLENAERSYLISSATNDDPNSKLSTVSRGRTIVDIKAVSDVANQSTLDAMVVRILAESKVYQKITFETLNMPNHEYSDCLYVDNSELGTSGKYIETGWQMDLKVGGTMKHLCRKAVSL